MHLNTQFLSELQTRASNHKSDGPSELPLPSLCFGEAFLQFSPLFKLYGEYASYHEAASEAIEEFEKSSSAAPFLRAVEADPRSAGQSLQSYLIMPVQRVPRYKLLLAELIKRTLEDHPDFASLEMALEHVEVCVCVCVSLCVCLCVCVRVCV